MIPRNLVEQIQKLLRQPRYSFTAIAQMVGVSHSTISAISKGTWNGFDYIYEVEVEPEAEHDPPVRCNTCGANVYLPCQTCLARLSVGIPTPDDPRQKSVDLELNEVHKERYERIRALRAGVSD